MLKFPTWLYHPTEKARIFNDAEAVERAGDGWRDTPYSSEELAAPAAEPEPEQTLSMDAPELDAEAVPVVKRKPGRPPKAPE